MDIGFFKVSKMGRLLGLGNDEKKGENLQVRASIGRHIEAVVASRSYQLTVGGFLKRGAEKDYAGFRLKLKDPKASQVDLQRLSARMEVWEEIENFVTVTINNGQRAAETLNEVSNNARTKRAS